MSFPPWACRLCLLPRSWPTCGCLVLAAAVASTTARYTLSLTIGGIQLDNPSPYVAFPVSFVLPAPPTLLTSTSTSSSVSQALSLTLAVWQRRPAGVLCAEHVSLALPSLALFIEQQHVVEAVARVVALLDARTRVTALLPSHTTPVPPTDTLPAGLASTDAPPGDAIPEDSALSINPASESGAVLQQGGAAEALPQLQSLIEALTVPGPGAGGCGPCTVGVGGERSTWTCSPCPP